MTKAYELMRNKTARIPDGRYAGTWGGYVVTFMVGGEEYRATTVEGVRTPAAAVWVDANDGELEVTLKSREGGE